MRTLIIPFLSLLFLLPSANTQAKIIHVPADSSCIQCAINGTSDGDTVLVADGHYYERINFYGKTILLTSEFMNDGDTLHIQNTIIDGDTSILGVADTGSVVCFVNCEDSTSVIQGFTIQNGIGTGYFHNDRRGGGIFCYQSSPTICNCVITHNAAFDVGAGILFLGGTPRIAHNTIADNLLVVPIALGDGIACAPSDSWNISDNTFIDNGIWFAGSFSNVLVSGNVFRDFSREGSAIFMRGSSSITQTLTIRENTFRDFATTRPFWAAIEIWGTDTVITRE